MRIQQCAVRDNGGPAVPAYWGGNTAHSAGKLGEDLPTDALHCLAPAGSSLQHSFRVLFLVIAEYFTAPGVYSPARGKSSDTAVGFFIWFASGVKAFQTRAVPGSAADDAEAKQNEQPYPHSEQVIYQKARSYDRFRDFFCQKVVKMRQRFFFCAFDFPRSIFSSVAA